VLALRPRDLLAWNNVSVYTDGLGSCARGRGAFLPVRRHRRSAGRAGRAIFKAWVAAVVMTTTAMPIATASAMPAPPPPQQALAVVKAGVVWYENGVVRLIGHGGKRKVLARWPEPFFGDPPQISSSETAVALLADRRFRGGVPPGPLLPLAEGRQVRAGDCRWRPAPHAFGNFVVAGDQLVLAASGGCTSTRGSARQPLFTKDLRGGPWRVLRWLPSTAPPILAADGNLLAVGVQRSLAAMDVLVLEVRGGSTSARLVMPDGYLAFAARDRLVVSVPTSRTFPITTDIETANGFTGPLPFVQGPYHLGLYSTRGPHLASLGTTHEQHPLVSVMHLVSNYDSQTRTSKVSVRALPSGPASDIIGFNAPGRKLIASALRWPLLALIETTSAALPNGRFDCGYGPYAPPSAPALITFDLAHRGPFVPAPVAPPEPDPKQVFATCGPLRS
jgi:hypothetical protein